MSRFHEKANFSDCWLGKYHFRNLLGRGGFASVWLADETNLSRQVIRPVAIKVFIDSLADKPSFQQTIDNFQLDIKYLADLAPHNPIINYYNSEVHDVFLRPDGVPETVDSRTETVKQTHTPLTAFIVVMEYADGGHLGPPYREAVVLQVDDRPYIDHFIDVCVGLGAAHSAGIIHRDIKPSNLMWFRKANKVKIGDFGIAKHVADLSQGGLYVVGTPAYMAPESFIPGAQATPERDVYALGCTFYEVLTGELAIDPADVASNVSDVSNLLEAVRLQHATTPRPDALVKVPNKVSVDLNALLKDMMHPHAASRPSLEKVIERLGREKRQVSTQRLQTAVIPTEPLLLSEYHVNPTFRLEHLKQTAFFVGLRIASQTRHKYKALFGALKEHFFDTYSVCELYGASDFLVEVWSTRDRLSLFCNKIIDEVLDDNRNALHILACDRAAHLGAKTECAINDEHLSRALVRLNEAQTADADETKRGAVEWLRRMGVYVRKRSCDVAGPRVRSFCFVSHAEHVSLTDRQAHYAQIIHELERAGLDARKLDLSIYSKAYQSVEGLENDSSDYVISYIAPTFNDVIAVPSLLLDRLTGHRFKVVTMLATKRYYVDSDRVRVA